jgi:hypothetical protein
MFLILMPFLTDPDAAKEAPKIFDIVLDSVASDYFRAFNKSLYGN